MELGKICESGWTSLVKLPMRIAQPAYLCRLIHQRARIVHFTSGLRTTIRANCTRRIRNNFKQTTQTKSHENSFVVNLEQSYSARFLVLVMLEISLNVGIEDSHGVF